MCMDHIGREPHEVGLESTKLSQVRASRQHDGGDQYSVVAKLRRDQRLGNARLEQHCDVHVVTALLLTDRERVDDSFQTPERRRCKYVHEPHRFDAIPASRRLNPCGEIPAGTPRRGKEYAREECRSIQPPLTRKAPRYFASSDICSTLVELSPYG